MFPNVSQHEFLLFLFFNVLVLFMLVLDLGYFNKQKEQRMSVKKAAIWTTVWIALALSFAFFIYLYDTDPENPGSNKTKALEYIAAYLLEKSLSVDNLFVFIMIFQKYKIGPTLQPTILKWGIIGALILRAIMIVSGAALIAQFSWILYIFGIFLIYTAIKMFTHKEDDEEEFNPENSKTYNFLKKIIPMTDKFDKDKFFIIENGKRYATPLFIVLILIELSDVVFAFDSIPAVFSISQNPFIVYTSNIFAILGLRALFFMISGIMDLFIYLKTGVAIILGFVGVKMLVPLASKQFMGEEIHISISISLTVITAILFISIFASLPNYLKSKKG
jgi:tellurite resistance protein TerC